MRWMDINEIDGQFAKGDRILALYNDRPDSRRGPFPRLLVFELLDSPGDNWRCCDSIYSDMVMIDDCSGWLPEEAVAKFLAGEILDDSDGIPVCAECMQEPCQCSSLITPPSEGVEQNHCEKHNETQLNCPECIATLLTPEFLAAADIEAETPISAVNDTNERIVDRLMADVKRQERTIATLTSERDQAINKLSELTLQLSQWYARRNPLSEELSQRCEDLHEFCKEYFSVEKLDAAFAATTWTNEIRAEEANTTSAALAEALEKPFLKCPKCNDGCMGTDITDEAIDCHYCDSHGRITAEAFCDQHDKLQALVGDAMVHEFELKEVAESLEELMEWQNGPPLSTIKWTTSWTAAMEKARAALALHRKATT